MLRITKTDNSSVGSPDIAVQIGLRELVELLKNAVLLLICEASLEVYLLVYVLEEGWLSVARSVLVGLVLSCWSETIFVLTP